MIEIMNVTEDLEKKAMAAAQFRNCIKEYLKSNNRAYDKFTITENDFFLGYVSETAVINYLCKQYNGIINIRRWSDEFDIERIVYAVRNNICTEHEVEYVQEYFYDKYDIKIIDNKTGNYFRADVKTAETKKIPQLNWDFLYPVVQNEREGKECVILCYYCKWSDGNRIILVGYITEEEIRTKNLVLRGTRTRRGTLSQIDNYKTLVTDYKTMDNMLNLYFGVSK
ncbi:MAG: hypothetical protein IJ079_06185 [Lachnospiraceae bacterium]|nr:hypothetical protein [Lachnospiraceae bacterium]